jgi:poly-gamma-glutamate capsule biosynthesis protein CapA/YwtB (metallophosphatase superfamily)
MIQSRQQRHRRRKRRHAGLLLFGAAIMLGASAALAVHGLPGADRPEPKPPVETAANRPGAEAESSAQGGGKAGTGGAIGGAAAAQAGAAGQAGEATGESAAAGGGAGQPAAVPRVRMAFVGDVMLADTVEKLLQQNGYDYPYGSVKPLLAEPDVTVANLETPVTERGAKQTKEYVYRSSPKALPALKESGVDIVNLANNHIMDYGAEGMLDTISLLDREGIAHVGAGHNLEEALKPAVVTKQGIRIAFLGFSRVVPDNSWKASAKQAGVADTYNYTVPVETIRKAKEQADLVVVLAHWGTERKDTPDPVQTDLAHRYVDAGADLVVASHPHVLQGLEAYKGKWIAYSLGNFIFTTNDVAKTWETIVLQAECAKNGGCLLKAVPILTKWAKPEPMSGDAGAALLRRLSALSFRARVGADGAVVEDAAATGPPVTASASAAAPGSSKAPVQTPPTNKK